MLVLPVSYQSVLILSIALRYSRPSSATWARCALLRIQPRVMVLRKEGQFGRTARRSQDDPVVCCLNPSGHDLFIGTKQFDFGLFRRLQHIQQQTVPLGNNSQRLLFCVFGVVVVMLHRKRNLSPSHKRQLLFTQSIHRISVLLSLLFRRCACFGIFLANPRRIR